MAHAHPIYDTNKRFVIDAATKNIAISDANKPVLVQYDNYSEVITFEIDRYAEGHDLSLSNKVEIHYNNIDTTGRRTSRGLYPVEKFGIDPDNAAKVLVSWLISEEATKYEGTLNFVVSFSCLDDDVFNVYRWNSHIGTLQVSAGINNTEYLEQNYADVLEMWKQDLFGIGDTEEGRMRILAQQLQDEINDKGQSTLKSIPDAYLDYEAFADSIDTPSAIRINQSGYYLNAVGAPMANPSYAITDYIHYSSGDILLRGIWIGESARVICYYDADKNFISGINNTEGTLLIAEEDVPAGTAYIRCSTLTASSSNPVVFINKYELIAKNRDRIETLEGEMRASIQEQEYTRSYLERELEFSVGGYIYYPDGWINKTDSARITDYTPVSGYNQIAVTAFLADAGYLLAYYDSDKNLLPDISVRGFGNVTDIYTIPESAYYVRVSNYGLTNECNARLIGKKSLLKKSYKGKKILTIGDSITAIESGNTEYARSWKKYFCEIVEPSLLISTAVPGATWCDKAGTVYDGDPVNNGADNNANNVIGNQVEKIVRNYDSNPQYSEFDAIFIAAGTNDEDDASTLTDAIIEESFYTSSGAISDLASLNRTTWAGAMRYTIDTLRNLYPNADIFVCTPIQRYGRGQYVRVRSKAEAIKKIAKRLGVILVDSLDCGVYDMTCPSGGKEGDFNDGLHLSAQGAKKLGRYNARKLIDYYSYEG